MPSLFQGRIVFALDPIPDPQGRNPKANRPFIVISDNEYIAANPDVVGVAVSSKTFYDGDNIVALPLHQGYPQTYTKLDKPSVAVCDWTASLPQSRIDIGNGYIKPKELKAILQKRIELGL